MDVESIASAEAGICHVEKPLPNVNKELSEDDGCDDKESSFMDHLSKWRKSVRRAISAAVLFLLIALILWLLSSLCKPPRKHSSQYSYQLNYEGILEQKAERALKKALQAERIAEKASAKEDALARELADLKSLLKEHGIERAKANQKEPNVLQRALNRWFRKEPEHSKQAAIEHQGEPELAGEYEKSHQYLYSLINELQEEQAALLKYAHSLETQLGSLYSSLHHLDTTLAADFATVDADLRTIDSALLASLRRHREERAKINEIIGTIYRLDNEAAQEVERIDELTGQVAAVEAAARSNADAIRQTTELAETSAEELRAVREMMQQQGARLRDMQEVLETRAQELSSRVETVSGRADEALSLSKILCSDLHALQEAIGDDLELLSRRLEKLKKQSQRLPPELLAYGRKLRQVESEIAHLRASIERQSAASSPAINVAKWATNFNHLSTRVSNLEQARERGLQDLQAAMETERSVDEVRRRQEAAARGYDVERGERKAQKWRAEMEADQDRLADAANRQLMGKLLEPGRQLMDELRTKYRGENVEEVSFDREHREY